MTYTGEKRKEYDRQKAKRYYAAHGAEKRAQMRKVYGYRKGSLEWFTIIRLGAIRHRAKQNGLEFNLDKEWVEAQPLTCAVSGSRFEIPETGMGPLTPSFDRIDPKQGYTKQNTRLVCMWVNTAKMHWPDEQIQNLILAAAEHITLLRSTRD